MLPYFPQPGLSLGPFTVHAFGVLVVCAIWVGTTILQRRAHAAGLDRAIASRFVNWILLGAFLGAHLFDRLVYFPGQTARDPLSLLRLWEGLSSFGGFLGGTLAGLVFFKRHVPSTSRWVLVDSFAFAFPFGWIFGRLGCFVAFDHPGRPTSFFLGQMDADGVVRHNLGLEEALYTMLLAALFAWLGRRTRYPGFFLALLLVAYAPLRFALDFLRIVDVRYGGLTPGQYGCVALLLVGALLAYVRRARFRHRPALRETVPGLAERGT